MASQDNWIHPSVTTRTTIMIAGADQHIRLDVTNALTASAAVFATFGAIRMVITDPAVPRGLVGSLRSLQDKGLTLTLPEKFVLSPERFIEDEHLVTVNWGRTPMCRTVPGGAYDPRYRRHVHWIDVEAGPLTFRFFDRAGHKAFVAELARAGQASRSTLLPAHEKAQIIGLNT